MSENEAHGGGWLVYMIETEDGALYTGITTDMARRWRQHRSGRGAKYLRGRQPRALVYLEVGHDRRSAAQREWRIKQLSRDKKRALPASAANALYTSPPLGLAEALQNSEVD
jgi:putative endonuclease